MWKNGRFGRMCRDCVPLYHHKNRQICRQCPGLSSSSCTQIVGRKKLGFCLNELQHGHSSLKSPSKPFAPFFWPPYPLLWLLLVIFCLNDIYFSSLCEIFWYQYLKVKISSWLRTQIDSFDYQANFSVVFLFKSYNYRILKWIMFFLYIDQYRFCSVL